MSVNSKNDNDTEKYGVTEKNKKSPWWITTLKVIGWTFFSIITFIIIACTLIVWILTPEQLTPMVEKHASEYLDANVTASRVELTFWHTFPKMTIDVDSLDIVSKSLTGLPDSVAKKLPANADSLLFIDRFHGGVNIAALSIGQISLYDVIFENIRINLVKADDNHANYNIAPESDEKDTTETSTSLPPISINRFLIKNAKPISYTSLSDSIQIEIDLDNIDFTGKDAPDYTLTVIADGRSPLLKKINLKNLPVKLDGKISWDDSKPYSINLNNFNISVDSLNTKLSTELDFSDNITVKSFDMKLEKWSVPYLLSLIPDSMAAPLKRLDTDMTVSINAIATEPFNPLDTTSYPSVNADIEIPDCHVYLDRLHFKKFNFTASVSFDGKMPDKSIAGIKRLFIDGNIMDIDFNGKISTPMSNPYIDANLKAAFNFNRMPEFVYSGIASKIKGILKADISTKFHRSDLSANRFHLMKLTGDVDIENFMFISADSVNRVFIGNSCLQFGTDMKYITDNQHTIDSLLTASVKIDTANVASGPIKMSVSNLKAGVGTRIGKNNADTTVVTPFGGMISFNRIKIDDSTDSSLIRLNGIRCRASLTRFEGNSHAPLLKLNFDSDRMIATDRKSFIFLSKSHFDVKANLRKRMRPNLSSDSIKAIRRRIANNNIDNDESRLDIEVDSGIKAALQRWNVTGSITAERGGFITPAIPVRNRLRDVEFDFSTDSIVLKNMIYNMGESDFTIKGTIGNIRRALTRKRNNTLNIDFEVNSDTINVNEISRIIMSGGNSNSDIAAKEIIDYEKIPDEITLVMPDTTESKAFVVPSNMKANIKIKSKNVVYTDIMLHQFNGEILINNSVVNLRNLAAATDIGSLGITALYSAPDKNDIQFGIGMKINDFNIEKMTNLVPAVDSLMPLLHDFSGIISADIAATSRIDSTMNFIIPSLQAAIKLTGDSLVLLDADTFKSLSKWLMFKNKKRNMIDSMSVEIIVNNSQLELFPFIFDIDRYRLGIMGRNDMNMNLDYHISVLKSPMPFKFGINIKGNIDDMKIRLGGAKFKDKNISQRISIADTTRINLINQIENVFRKSANSKLTLRSPMVKNEISAENDTISAADSLLMIKEGFIEAPSLPDSIKPE